MTTRSSAVSLIFEVQAQARDVGVDRAGEVVLHQKQQAGKLARRASLQSGSGDSDDGRPQRDVRDLAVRGAPEGEGLGHQAGIGRPHHRLAVALRDHPVERPGRRPAGRWVTATLSSRSSTKDGLTATPMNASRWSMPQYSRSSKARSFHRLA